MLRKLHARMIERLESAIETLYYVAMLPVVCIVYMAITGTLPVA